MCLPWISTGFTLPVESHTPDLCEMSPPSLQPQLRSPRADPLWLPQSPVFGLRGSGSGRHTPSLSKQPFAWFKLLRCFELHEGFFFLIILCISFWLWWVFVAALAFSGCNEAGATLPCRAWASHCGGFSCGAPALGRAGFSSWGTWPLECWLSSWGTWA